MTTPRMTAAALLAVGLACGPVRPVLAQLLPGPRVELSQDAWNFGEVWHPTPAHLTLTVKNSGVGDLRLQKVDTTCGCTVVQPGRNVVPPNESTEIQVRYDTQGKQGHVTSKVIIESNDNSRPRIEFPIEGIVRRAITREPLGGLVIRSLDTSPGQSSAVRLENQMTEPMDFQFVGSDLPLVDVQVKEIEKGRVYELVGTTNREIPPGSLSGTIKVTTGLSREPRLDIPVSVRIMPMVDPSPPAIRLADTPLKRTINLRHYGRERLEVTGVETGRDDIRVRLSATRPPVGYEQRLDPVPRWTVVAQVDLPPSQALGGRDAWITFRTNLADYPEVKVLVTTSAEAFRKQFYAPPQGLETYARW